MSASRGIAALLVALAAGCTVGGDDEPESATAASAFVTELVRLGQEKTFGTVGVSPDSGKTRVVVEVAEDPPAEAPHITTGNCDTLGSGVVYQLAPFGGRVSETVVDVDLDQLRRAGYVVLVGDPRFGPTGGMCGDLAQAHPPGAAPTFD
jgi:hypothetical protein